MVEKFKEPEVDVGPESSTTEILTSGNSLIRLENMTQMQVSIQRPRDEAKILKDALAELDLYPDMAEEAIYSKPVGKDPTTGQMKYAEGLSVRAAESLANRWCNSGYGQEFAGSDDESVVVAAVFVDYENNTRRAVQKRVSRTYKTRPHGNTPARIVAHPPDRFNDVVIPANVSKVLREAILRSLPAGLKKAYENKARTLLKTHNIKQRVPKMIKAFSLLKVTAEEIEKLMGKKSGDFSHDDVDTLLGSYNAIQQGEMTVNEFLGKEEPVKTTAQPQSTTAEEDALYNPEKCSPCNRLKQCKLLKNAEKVDSCKGPFNAPKK